jgi:hypothetical protein
MEESPKNKGVAPSIVIGFVLALIAMGLPMIGVAVNLYFGAGIFLAAFILLAYGFWRWERARRWSEAVRVSSLWILGILYFAIVGIQLFSQYRKDRTSTKPVIVNSIPTVSQTPQPQDVHPRHSTTITPPRASTSREH